MRVQRRQLRLCYAGLAGLPVHRLRMLLLVEVERGMRVQRYPAQPWVRRAYAFLLFEFGYTMLDGMGAGSSANHPRSFLVSLEFLLDLMFDLLEELHLPFMEGHLDRNLFTLGGDSAVVAKGVASGKGVVGYLGRVSYHFP